MQHPMTTLLLTWCLFLPQLALAADKADYYKLYSYLFEDPQFYKKHVRPAVNETHPIKVDVFFFLNSLIDVNEKEQTLVSSGTLQFIWEDTYLAWDGSKFGDIDYFLVPQSLIYLPDIIVSNSVRKTVQLGYPEQRVRLTEEGKIIWQPNVLLVTSCNIHITYFPFDTQVCYISLTTAVSARSEVKLVAATSFAPIALDDFGRNGQWELAETDVKDLTQKGNDKTIVRYGVKLKRRKIFYMVNIVMPVFFLSMTSSLVFALPADEGEKMGTGITVLLAFAVYLTIVSELVPNTSLQVSVLALYLTAQLGMCAVSVLVCAFILRLHFRDDDIPVGPRTTQFTRFLQRLTCARKVGGERTNKVNPEVRDDTECRMEGDTKPQNGDNELKNTSSLGQVASEDRADSLTWKDVAKTMDGFCFVLFTVLCIVITFMCMLILSAGGERGAPTIDFKD